jgi:hypothetical protein
LPRPNQGAGDYTTTNPIVDGFEIDANDFSQLG